MDHPLPPTNGESYLSLGVFSLQVVKSSQWQSLSKYFASNFQLFPYISVRRIYLLSLEILKGHFFKEKIQIIQVVPGMDPLNAQLRYMELVDQYVKYTWKNQEYFGWLVHFLDFQSSVKCRSGHHSLFPGL